MIAYFFSVLLGVFLMFVAPPLLWVGVCELVRSLRARPGLWPRQHDHEERDANGGRW